MKKNIVLFYSKKIYKSKPSENFILKYLNIFYVVEADDSFNKYIFLSYLIVLCVQKFTYLKKFKLQINFLWFFNSYFEREANHTIFKIICFYIVIIGNLYWINLCPFLLKNICVQNIRFQICGY